MITSSQAVLAIGIEEGQGCGESSAQPQTQQDSASLQAIRQQAGQPPDTVLESLLQRLGKIS